MAAGDVFLRGDQIVIKKQGGFAELVLQNATSGLTGGYLKNVGGGLLEFDIPAPGSAAWGSITGTLSAQTDLNTALNARQPLDADLTAIAGLSAVNNDILQFKSGAWTNRTLIQYKTDLNLNLVENTALSTWPGSTNITTLGTIVAGIWNAQAIAINKGGVPSGGTTGQVLKKLSNTDYDYSWGTDLDTGGGGGISDGLKGDINVTGSGTIWTIPNSTINTIRIADAAVTDVKVAAGIDAIKLADGSVSNTEFQYINSLTSNAQTQLDGKMAPNIVNTMGASGRIVFPSLGTDSVLKVGSFEIQGRSTTSSLIGHNVYNNGTSFIHRATGPLSFMDINPTATSFLFGMATSATAGTAATVTYPLGIYPTGLIVGISSGYINFDSVTGSTGWGFRDNAGVMQWKNAGGSWANISAGGGGLSDGTYADIIVSSGTTVFTISNLAVTTAKLAALAVTDAKINDVAFSKVTGTMAAARIAGTATDGLIVKLVSGVPTWSTDISGGGLSDGTYNDITLSASASVWTIVNNAVTTAKINALAVTNAKINDVAFGKITGITGTPTGSKFLRDDGSWQTVSGSATLTSTRLAFGDGSNLITDSANLVWDNTNKNILIGGSGSRNININVSQPTIGFLQSGTEKGVIGISDAVDALVLESAVGDMAVRLTTLKKFIISDDATRYIKIGFTPSADTICGDAPFFQTHTDTTALGHGSTAFIFQNLDSGNSSRIGWKNHLGSFMGEIGPNNVDGNFGLLVSDPSTAFIFGWHADGVIDSPLIQMMPDGKIRFYHWAAGAVAYTHPGIWDFKNNWFVFGDDTNDTSYTMQVHDAGTMGMKGTLPMINFQGSGLTTGFTGYAPANVGGRSGLLHSTSGGAFHLGLSAGDEIGFVVGGVIGSASPTVPAVAIRGYKSDGSTSLTGMSGAEIILSVEAGGTPKFRVLADGSLSINGSVGTAGQVVTSGGSGATAAWGAGGGGGSPAGSDTQVQFNNAGSFGASAALAFVDGGIKMTNVSDTFLSSNGVIGHHSNNFMYLQGGSSGFIVASSNARANQIQVRADLLGIYFLTDDGAANPVSRVLINSSGLHINAGGTNRSGRFFNADIADNFSIIDLLPSSGTNVTNIFRVMPKGTGTSRIDLYNTDRYLDATNYELIGFGANGTSYDFNSQKGGTGTLRPINFQIASTTAFTIAIDGSLKAQGLPTFADETAAAGLPTDTLYQTSTGEIRIKL